MGRKRHITRVSFLPLGEEKYRLKRACGINIDASGEGENYNFPGGGYGLGPIHRPESTTILLKLFRQVAGPEQRLQTSLVNSGLGDKYLFPGLQ